MRLRDTILREHSKPNTLKIVSWIGSDKKRFGELMKLMLYDEYRVGQRAAWPISYCIRKYPALLDPWLGKMIDNLEKPGIHDAVRRNTLRVLEDYDIPEKYCGRVYDLSYKYLHSLEQPVAVRAFALTVLANIAKKYPDLRGEIRHNAESLLHCGIPALESRSRDIIKVFLKKRNLGEV